MVEGIVIRNTPQEYQKYFNYADRNCNGEIDNYDEALTATKEFFKETQPKKEFNEETNHAKNNERVKFLDYLERTRLSMGDLSIVTGFSDYYKELSEEVNYYIKLFNNRDQVSWEKAFLALGNFSSSESVPAPIKESMVYPLIKQLGRRRNPLIMDGLSNIFSNLAKSNISAAAKTNMFRLLAHSLSNSNNMNRWTQALEIIVKIIEDPEAATEIKNELISYAIDSLKADNMNGIWLFANITMCPLELPDLGNIRNISEENMEILIIDPLIKHLKETKNNDERTSIILILYCIIGSNISKRLKDKIIAPLIDAMIISIKYNDLNVYKLTQIAEKIEKMDVSRELKSRISRARRIYGRAIGVIPHSWVQILPTWSLHPPIAKSDIPAQQFKKTRRLFVNPEEDFLYFKSKTTEEDIDKLSIPDDLKNFLRQVIKQRKGVSRTL